MRAETRSSVIVPLLLAATLALLPGALELRLRASARTGAELQAAPASPAATPAPRRPSPAPSVPAASALPAPVLVPADVDARRTQEELGRVLEQQPPTLRRVLQFDPTLLTNQDYLASYPALAAFLATHPEVARNPTFFVGQPDWDPRPQSDAVRIWSDFTSNASIMVVFLTVTSALVWLLKSLFDESRWRRVSKIHAEMQAKLVDRFTTSDELLAYMQTPLGQRLVDAVPAPLETPAVRMSAPLGRILWSLQAGLVLGAAGVGFLLVSRHVPVELSPLLSVVGVLGIALGVGFVVSSFAAWALSQRLGLLKPQGGPGHDADARGAAA